MTDKRSICSAIDAIVIDIIPEHIGAVIDHSISLDEDVRAAIKGIKGEALVVTDRGVHTIKNGDCRFFPYDRITSTEVSRVYRRGRFEIMLNDAERQPRQQGSDFGPDMADTVINFPWAKAPLFKKARDIVKVNRERALAAPSLTPKETAVTDEIERLRARLRELEESRAE